MENEKDKTTEEQKKSQPKPTDDVQLGIETVIPSAEKEEVTSIDDDPLGKENEEALKKSIAETEADEKNASTNTEENKDNSGDDHAEKIETITPSA